MDLEIISQELMVVDNGFTVFTDVCEKLNGLCLVAVETIAARLVVNFVQ